MTTKQPNEKTSGQKDFSHADIGIVCALSLELKAFLNRCEKVRSYTGGDFKFRGGFYDDIRIVVAESGTGFANARRATQAMIDAHSPRWILSCGFSGALIPKMKIGNIIVANDIMDTHGQSFLIEHGMSDNREHGLYVDKTVTSDKIVRLIKEKKELAEETGAVAVDMESLAVAQIAKESGTKFLSVRVISDDLSADLPAEVLSIMGENSKVRIGAALTSIWNRPGSVKDLWQLREQAVKASEKLATFLDGVVTQLYQADH